MRCVNLIALQPGAGILHGEDEWQTSQRNLQLNLEQRRRGWRAGRIERRESGALCVPAWMAQADHMVENAAEIRSPSGDRAALSD